MIGNGQIQAIDGLEIPNLVRASNACAYVLKIRSKVYLLPMRVKLDENAYAMKDALSYKIYLSRRIIDNDRADKAIIRILLHELTHIKQMENEDLVLADNGNIAIWKGEVYSSKAEYSTRPWEAEARKAESKYINEAWRIINVTTI